MFPFLLLGVLGGCIGGAFTAVNTRIAAKRDELLAYSKSLKMFETAVLAVVIALIAYGSPRALTASTLSRVTPKRVCST